MPRACWGLGVTVPLPSKLGTHTRQSGPESGPGVQVKVAIDGGQAMVRVSGFGFRVQGSGFKMYNMGFRVAWTAAQPERDNRSRALGDRGDRLRAFGGLLDGVRLTSWIAARRAARGGALNPKP